jgi:hypothetical protein
LGPLFFIPWEEERLKGAASAEQRRGVHALIEKIPAFLLTSALEIQPGTI